MLCGSAFFFFLLLLGFVWLERRHRRIVLARGRIVLARALGWRRLVGIVALLAGL